MIMNVKIHKIKIKTRYICLKKGVNNADFAKEWT